jgi:ankyrin repeat protein
MFFDDEYDFNRRTTKRPAGVNRDGHDGDKNKYTVTVGDLCFVALGQIVNRRFNAVRYQPTACIMINSPTESETLRKVIKAEWSDLTSAKHKERLIQDFTEPDHEYRRIGACLRLGYFYPDALEPLVLKQLAASRYDVFEVQALIREKLYRARDAKERKTLFDAFVAKGGEAGREGCLVYLFDDLDTQEADEEGRLGPPLKEKYRARECLIELYSYPKDVKSTKRPRLVPTDNSTQARFIEALNHFPSPKIDRAVREVLHSTDHDYLARSCVHYLTGRNADPDIKRYVEQRLKKADKERRKELESLLAQLGWTRLHAAAETNDTVRIEELILGGAEVNAPATNGRTPLHVAAEHGAYDAIEALLKRKANANAKDKQGRTPVQLGIEYDSAVEMLLHAGAEPTDILVATFAGRVDLVNAFLAKDRTLISAKTEKGRTALHLAADRGHPKVAETLVAHGADVNARDDGKFTPLHLAAIGGQYEIVELLLANKVDRNAKSWDNKTPLDYAKRRKDGAKTVELLEKK